MKKIEPHIQWQRIRLNPDYRKAYDSFTERFLETIQVEIEGKSGEKEIHSTRRLKPLNLNEQQERDEIIHNFRDKWGLIFPQDYRNPQTPATKFFSRISNPVVLSSLNYPRSVDLRINLSFSRQAIEKRIRSILKDFVLTSAEEKALAGESESKIQMKSIVWEERNINRLSYKDIIPILERRFPKQKNLSAKKLERWNREMGKFLGI